jgi:hypothetical protein
VIAVVVSGTEESPQALTRAEIPLTAPEAPSLFQPYHEVMKRLRQLGWL